MDDELQGLVEAYRAARQEWIEARAVIERLQDEQSRADFAWQAASDKVQHAERALLRAAAQTPSFTPDQAQTVLGLAKSPAAKCEVGVQYTVPVTRAQAETLVDAAYEQAAKVRPKNDA